MRLQATIHVLVPNTSLLSDGDILLGIEAATNDSSLALALQVLMSSASISRTPGMVTVSAPT
jgi:hypothetical protein